MPGDRRLRCALAVLATALSAPLASVDHVPAILAIPQRDPTQQPADPSSLSLSADGTLLSFSSYAALVDGDANAWADVYGVDLTTGRLTLESGTAPGEAATPFYGTRHPRLSGDGRLVVYADAVRLPDGTSRCGPVVRNRQTGERTLVAVTPRGEPASPPSHQSTLSGDGTIVAFTSQATTLTDEPDANGPGDDVYVRDLGRGETGRVNLDAHGAQPGTGTSHSPALSADGRFVVFASSAPLVPHTRALVVPSVHPLTPSATHVYVRDLLEGTTRQVDLTDDDRPPDARGYHPAVSGDGRFVAFVSEATNLVPGDRNRVADVFVRDLVAATTVLVSRRAGGGSANAPSAYPAISTDGRFVAFQSQASNLVDARRGSTVQEDDNLVWDVFVWDREAGVTTRLSRDADGGWSEPSFGAAIDFAGRTIAFSSFHPTGPADHAHDVDAFVVVPGAVLESRSSPVPANHAVGRKASAGPPRPPRP